MTPTQFSAFINLVRPYSENYQRFLFVFIGWLNGQRDRKRHYGEQQNLTFKGFKLVGELVFVEFTIGGGSKVWMQDLFDSYFWAYYREQNAPLMNKILAEAA